MWGGLRKVMRDYAFWQSHGRRRAFQMNLSKLSHFRGTYTVSVCVSLDGWLTATLSSSRHKSQLRREILSMNVLLPSMLQLWLIGVPNRGDARCQWKILTSVHTCFQLKGRKNGHAHTLSAKTLQGVKSEPGCHPLWWRLGERKQKEDAGRRSESREGMERWEEMVTQLLS